MISGMTVMLSKSFSNPSSSGFLTSFWSPSLFPQPVCRVLNFRFKPIGEASSAGAFLIFPCATCKFSASMNHEQFGKNKFVGKHSRSLLKPWSEEVRVPQLARSKKLPPRNFSSKTAGPQGTELESLHERAERGRNLSAAQHDRIPCSSFTVDESPEHKGVPLSTDSNEDSEEARSEDSRIEQSVISGRVPVRKDSSGVRQEEEKLDQMTVFEQWALNKIRETGLSSLTVIEDMRQIFAPGSPPLDPRLLFSEAEFRELESPAISSRSFQPETATSVDREDKRSSVSMDEPMPGHSKPSRSFSDKRNSVKRTEESKSNVAASPQTNPLLVKRKTTLPENWNGPGGTVVLIDKPQGWTSFAVCGKLRHMLKIQKVGHAGTLDPLATGLLIVCLGKATKLADSYQAMTKVYSGVFRLGEDTPSLDADTEVSDILPWEHIRDEDIERAKHAFIGDILQSPPMYSAIKIKGERLYAKARRGEAIEVPARRVTVHDFEVNRSPYKRQEFHFRVTCSKGTYIRSLCSDLGRALGSYAHLTALRREKIGSYSVSEAWTIEDLVENYTQQFRNFDSRSKA